MNTLPDSPKQKAELVFCKPFRRRIGLQAFLLSDKRLIFTCWRHLLEDADFIAFAERRAEAECVLKSETERIHIKGDFVDGGTLQTDSRRMHPIGEIAIRQMERQYEPHDFNKINALVDWLQHNPESEDTPPSLI